MMSRQESGLHTRCGRDSVGATTPGPPEISKSLLFPEEPLKQLYFEGWRDLESWFPTIRILPSRVSLPPPVLKQYAKNSSHSDEASRAFDLLNIARDTPASHRRHCYLGFVFP